MRLDFGGDRRAQRLLDSLDTIYFRFAEELPSPLNEAAMLESTILGQPREGRFTGLSRMNPLIVCSPWLFWETFCTLDDDTFLGIAAAGAFLSLASVVMDHLVDGQAAQLEVTALLHHAFYERGVSGFRKIFPASSSFWLHFDRLSQEYLVSIVAEINAQSNPVSFSFNNFLAFAAGKVSPAVIPIAAMAEASNQTWLLEPIETSFRQSFVAGQMHDDVLDWQLDINQRHLTFFLTRLVPPQRWMDTDWPSLDELQEANDQHWLDVEYFGVVIEHFDRCVEVVKGIACEGWMNYLQKYRGVAEEHRKAMVAQHLLRILDPVI